MNRQGCAGWTASPIAWRQRWPHPRCSRPHRTACTSFASSTGWCTTSTGSACAHTFSHIHGFRPEDLLCAPPISILHIRRAAAPQTPSQPDVVAYYFARLQAALTVQWLPHGMPAGSQIFHRMVPGMPPGHWLREVGAPLPPQGILAAHRVLPPGPPLAPPSPIAQAPPWLPLVHNEWMPPRTNLDLAAAAAGAPQAPGGPAPLSRRRRPQASHPLGRTRFRRSTSPCPLWIQPKSRVAGPSLPPQLQPAPRCGGPGPPAR